MEEVFVKKFLPFIKDEKLAKELIHALHAKSQLLDQSLASLPPKLDECWHAMLLETDLYKEFCDAYCGGRFVRHTTTTESTNAKVALLKALVIVCGNVPDEEVWNTDILQGLSLENYRATKRSRGNEFFDILIKNIYGKTLTLRMQGNYRVSMLFKHASVFFGIAEDSIRLIHLRTQIEKNSNDLEENGIGPGAILHLVERVRGC
ncbi:MAG: hypothetical protein K2Q45_09035 [Nitrosomonas sp.]|nr:hypothetical protein [Nitrosomonas sp.]